jgi:hypothetical protein
MKCMLIKLGLLMMLFSSSLTAQVLKTQQEALDGAFPKPQTVKRQTLFLDEAQVEAIQKLARAKVESQIVTYYVGEENGWVVGYAFFESGIVRTKPATIMAVINPDSTIRLIEILAFYEPQDYLPAPRWLELFRNKFLNDGLWPRRDIHHITGATLTVQALTQWVRKTLAIYQVAVSKKPGPSAVNKK